MSETWNEEPDSTPFPPLYVILTDGDEMMLMPCKLLRVRDNILVLAVTPDSVKEATHNPIGFPHPFTDKPSE